MSGGVARASSAASGGGRASASSLALVWSDCVPPSTAASAWKAVRTMRSEEHTSELQSRLHLVCRLLLEKKKKEGPSNHHLHSGDSSECSPSRQRRTHRRCDGNRGTLELFFIRCRLPRESTLSPHARSSP